MTVARILRPSQGKPFAITAAPEDGPFPHWHMKGYCHNSHPERRKHKTMVPAKYWWLGPNGYWFASCSQCMVDKFLVADANPDLAPVLVLPVEQP